MPPAVIAGGIAAVGTIGGAVLSSSAQKSAANKAAAAETNAANANIAQANQFRAANQANFQPNLNSGQRANALIDSFLYGPAPVNYYTGEMPAPAATPAAQTNPGQQVAPVTTYPAQTLSMTPNEAKDMSYFGAEPETALARRFNPLNALLGVPRAQSNPPTPQLPGATQQTPANPFSGYAAFVNSPYYQFPLQEGMRQLNTGLASSGNLNSGDAMKAAIRYGQDYGYQRMGDYLGLAENQTNRGVQAAGAIAGVGVNALSSITNSNNAIGQSAANRAIASGVANANMYSSIGGALGNLAGTLVGGSSYRGF